MQRKDVPVQYKWKTEDLYASDAAWQAECDEVSAQIDFSEFAGKLGTAEGLLAYFKKESTLLCRLERLYLYAHMKML